MSELISKLAKVAKSLPHFAADKRNQQQKYDYISADQVLDRVGDAMAENGIMVIPAITEEHIEAVPWKQGSRYDAMVGMEMTITDGKDTIVQQWIGRGSDYIVPDKATYKAITTGHKYFLMKLYNIGIGNDDGEHQEEPKPRQQAQKQAPPPPSSNGAPMPTQKQQTGNERRITLAMAKDWNIAGQKKHGDKWTSVKADILAQHGIESSKELPWQPYWDTLNEFNGEKETA